MLLEGTQRSLLETGSRAASENRIGEGVYVKVEANRKVALRPVLGSAYST